MSTASTVITTAKVINTAAPLSSFEKAKNAYDHRDNDEIIVQATSTNAHIEQLELLSMLEHRVHALSMKSKFGAAAQDAERMIEYAPTLPQGYLCFGKLFTMQGKQTSALKVYQEGLEKVPTNDPAYGQLLQAKKMADEKNNQRFDLVSALPLEVKDEIVRLLPEEERFNLFYVSTTWSQRLENCQMAWKYIYNKHDHDMNIAFSRLLPKIAKHISHLIFTRTTEEVWLKYLEHLENGHFRNLKSFQLTDLMDFNVFSRNSVMSIMNGFWKTRYTLTKIDLDFQNYGSPITITDILFHLPYLETLAVQSQGILDNILGDLKSLQEPHRCLVDLSLVTDHAPSSALKLLTKWCPYVKRLRLGDAEQSALDIVSDYFPNVEMLGYNNDDALPESHNVLNQEYNNNEPIIPSISMNNMYTKQEEGRIRALYCSSGWTRLPVDGLFRLLQKNQKTLEIIHVSMSRTREDEIKDEIDDNFPPDYPIEAASTVLNLDRLETLVFESDNDGIYEPLVYRLVRPSLKYFEACKILDLTAVVDTLISSQPPLETLGFREIYIEHNDQENAIARQCMARLLNEYAATPLRGPNTTKNLRNVMLEDCGFISDDVLDVLANIKTIKGLSLGGRSKMTLQGLKNLFIKLKKQITNLRFGNMESVVDTKALLDMINTMEGLEGLHLFWIPGLTVNDILAVIDNAKKLNTLIVENCGFCYSDKIRLLNSTTRKFKYLKIVDYRNYDIHLFNLDTVYHKDVFII